MRIRYHRLRRAAAVLLGIVFLLSGLLKIEDPVGTMLIVTEYFKFLHLSFLAPAAKVLGILLGSFEASLGVVLITGIWRKAAAMCSYLLLFLFTVITLLVWIFNPSMDCGCFGQAIHLTHAQSFFKNLVLLALAVIAFTPFQNFGVPPKRKRITAALAMLAVLYAVLYSNTHLPIVDFTDYDWGAELFASLDDDVEGDNHYREAYLYEKDGQQGQFLYGAPDSSWNLVAVDTLFRERLNDPSAQFPILGFSDAEGEYQDRLAAEGSVVVFSVYDPAHAPWERIQKQYHAVEEAGGRPLLLVASYPGEVDAFGIPFDLAVYYADYKTLITLNRSNGGGSHFHEGELINKWISRGFPKDIHYELSADPVDLSIRYISQRRIKVQGFCLYLAALLLLV